MVNEKYIVALSKGDYSCSVTIPKKVLFDLPIKPCVKHKMLLNYNTRTKTITLKLIDVDAISSSLEDEKCRKQDKTKES